jgi:hypothetical protein
MLVDACVAPTPCIGHGGTARKNPLLDINQSPISGARTRPAKERCITTKGMIGTQARPDIGLLSLVWRCDRSHNGQSQPHKHDTCC